MHTAIAHLKANDVMSSQSVKFRSDFESLIALTETLGKTCVLSGPIPSLGPRSEGFSSLSRLHCFLQNLCTATGIGFVNNFCLNRIVFVPIHWG